MVSLSTIRLTKYYDTGCFADALQAIVDHPLSDEKVRVSVIGGGAWGSSLALHCGRKGHEVMVWAREPEVVESINKEHENTMFFKVKNTSRRMCRTGRLCE